MQAVVTALVDETSRDGVRHDIENICRSHTLPLEDRSIGWSGAWKLVERWGDTWPERWFSESSALLPEGDAHRYATGEEPRVGDVVIVDLDTLIPKGQQGTVTEVLAPDTDLSVERPFHPGWCLELSTRCWAWYGPLAMNVRLHVRLLALVRRAPQDEE